ncbi:hypothetical protein [Caballeronia sp. ATUFL_M1_KS5A]|uniref:hypothetical protein n=1 Tax=Caballeronia sp. ATUFL_M1_KS5A TaxID=2921778 RepID=UPI0020279EB5|nr:hypothetical protein [Caballeronia sp. ATUFL_M1_KS5A]
MTVPSMRLVFAIAAHLHMTAGTVLNTMGAHEFMCWAHVLGDANRPPPPLELDVEDEIAAWR